METPIQCFAIGVAGCHAFLARDTPNPRLFSRREQPQRTQRTQSEEWKRNLCLLLCGLCVLRGHSCLASELTGEIFPHRNLRGPPLRNLVLTKSSPGVFSRILLETTYGKLANPG